MTMTLLESKRLKVQQLNQQNLLTYYNLYNNPEMMQYVGPVLDFKECLHRFYGILHQYQSNSKEGTWGIWLKERNELAGIIMFKEVQPAKTIEIGYRMDKKYWGNGFTKEVVGLARQYAFKNLGIEKMVALVHPRNQGSKKVLLSNGFFLEKTLHFKQIELQCFATYSSGA